jgi:hypothetical protein
MCPSSSLLATAEHGVPASMWRLLFLAKALVVKAELGNRPLPLSVTEFLLPLWCQ